MIFITGCNGLIGSFIAKKFLDEGFTVKALKRTNSDMSLLGEYVDKIEWVEGDILDVLVLGQALKGVETVVHSAAIVSYASSQADAIYKINVEGTANMVNAAINNEVKNFCMISSVAALGKNPKVTLVNENTDYDDSVFSTNYGKSKFLAEQEVFRGKEEGLNVFFVNPTVVLGPGDWQRGSSAIFKYIKDEKKFFTKGFINFVDVRDVAQVVYKLVEKPEGINGEKFILNAGKVTYEELFASIAKQFKVKKPNLEAGLFLSGLAWRFEYLKSFFTSKDPIITKESVNLSKSRFFYENHKVRSYFQFEFKTLDETVTWACRELGKKHSF
jgi:dihydroflavonol-4-reductase